MSREQDAKVAEKSKTCATCKWWELLDGSGVPYCGICLCDKSTFCGRLQIETDACGEHTPKEADQGEAAIEALRQENRNGEQ